MGKSLFAFFLLLTLVLQASTQTVIMTDKRYMIDRIEKIAIITQIPDEPLRHKVEELLLTAFEQKGISAINAYDFIEYDSAFYYSTLEREFSTAAVDGILIVKLVNIEITDMYIIPGDVLPPDAYNYFEFYSVYYYYDLPIISAPGYLSRMDRTFRIDMNLYSNKGDMIVMSAQTKLFDPYNPDKVIKLMGKKLAKSMSSKRLVVRN